MSYLDNLRKRPGGISDWLSIDELVIEEFKVSLGMTFYKVFYGRVHIYSLQM